MDPKVLATKLSSAPSPARGMQARRKSDAKTETWLLNKARLESERRIKVQAADDRRRSAKGRAEEIWTARRGNMEKKQSQAAERRLQSTRALASVASVADFCAS